MRKLIDINLQKNDQGLISDKNGTIRLFQLNRNNTKDKNREILWNTINQCSQFDEEWNNLFFD